MKSLIARIAIALLAVAALGGVSAVAVTASGPAPQTSTTKFEVRFMEGMIDHHQMAVELAEICLDKAVHSDLESQCGQIDSSQSAQIAQMQSWLQAWYGITYKPEMKPGDERMLERMEALPPEEFEVEFMTMMIRHHRQAIREAEGCLDRAFHGELRGLCQDIIASQSAEIRLFSMWLCDWYGVCQFERRFG